MTKHKWIKNPPKENGYYWTRRKVSGSWRYMVTFIYWHKTLYALVGKNNKPLYAKYTNITAYEFEGTYGYRYKMDNGHFSLENKYHRRDDGIFNPSKYTNLVVEYYTKPVKYIPDLSLEEVRSL